MKAQRDCAFVGFDPFRQNTNASGKSATPDDLRATKEQQADGCCIERVGTQIEHLTHGIGGMPASLGLYWIRLVSFHGSTRSCAVCKALLYKAPAVRFRALSLRVHRVGSLEFED